MYYTREWNHTIIDSVIIQLTKYTAAVAADTKARCGGGMLKNDEIWSAEW